MKQNEALDILKMGHNVYLTGAAGSGKTYVLNQFIDYLKKHGIVIGVTASTGIAATHMNGMTLHSWAGLGIEAFGPRDLERLLSKPVLRKRIVETKVLIIDEVSMLDGHMLDAVDSITRAFKDESKPFGGLQVVLSGDLFQLPPVARDHEPFFVFQSNAWNNMNLKICYLDEQHRQDDDKLLDLLGAIRSSTVETKHLHLVESRAIEPPKKHKNITKLYTHNRDVDTINDRELGKLKGNVHTYEMTSKGRKGAIESLVNRCLAPETLELKEGAEVMFVANSPAKYFVNGTLGTIIKFNEEGQPVVKTNDRIITVEPHTWKTEDGAKTIAQITQLPLRLAWAITIHKSQGMSLDAAIMDLSSSFEPGMGYVALSRVSNLDGLFVNGVNDTAMMVNPTITKLDSNLTKLSKNTQKTLATMDKKIIKSHHKKVRLALRPEEEKLLEGYDEKLYAKLKEWRSKKAKEQSAPAYTILQDNTLKLIAAIKPQNEKQLTVVKGIGPKKLEEYSKEVLKIVTS